MKIKTTALFLIFCASAFSACSPQPVTMPLSPTPSASRTLAISTTVSATDTPRAFTRTPRPTFTLDSTEAIDATAQAGDATAQASLATDIAPFLEFCSNDSPGVFEHMSPDRQWTFCGNETIHIVNRNGKLWSFSYQDYLSPDALGIIGYTRSEHWSQDIRYLYFAPMAHIDSIDPLPWNAIALFRIDLEDGQIQVILPSKDIDGKTDFFYCESISPTGRRLVYNTDYDFRKIHIVDLHTGEEQYLVMPETYNYVGDYDWSEDGLFLTFRVYNPDTQIYYHLTYNIQDLSLVKSTALP